MKKHLAAIALLFLSACSEQSTPVAQPLPTGTWSGTAHQQNPDGHSTSYPMTLTIAADGSITSTYPSLKCSTHLIRLPNADYNTDYVEKLDKPSDACIDDGRVSLTPHTKDNGMDWGWKLSQIEGVYYATASLKKKH